MAQNRGSILRVGLHLFAGLKAAIETGADRLITDF
jgi:hypothetical protein